MAKKKIEEVSKAPESTGAFILPGDKPAEFEMIQVAMNANGLTLEDVQSARVRALDAHGNRMVIITTVDDKRIRHPIQWIDPDGWDPALEMGAVNART